MLNEWLKGWNLKVKACIGVAKTAMLCDGLTEILFKVHGCYNYLD